MGLWDTFLDRTVYFSFDQTGFLRHKKHFADEVWDAAGLTALVTGGSKGIGFSAGSTLQSLGATVYNLSRTPSSQFRHIPCDLSSQSDIISATEDLPPLDILIHNAGLMPNSLHFSKNGIELTWATHVLGPYILTNALKDAGKLKPGTRVIFVTSGGMYLYPLELEDLQWSQRDYNKYAAYANAKRAQVILTEYFSKTLPNQIVSAMHPGWVKTEGVAHSMPEFYKWMEKRLRTPDEGADTIVYLALTKPYKSGELWFDRHIAPKHLLKKTQTHSASQEALISLLNSQVQ